MAYDIVSPSSAKAADGQSNNFVVPTDADLRAELQVTASDTPTTLNVYIEHSSDGGTTWLRIGSFATVGAVATATESIAIPRPNAGLLRADWDVVGTSYTFFVTVRR